eukprot:3941615-Rhodomonas_salina.1
MSVSDNRWQHSRCQYQTTGSSIADHSRCQYQTLLVAAQPPSVRDSAWRVKAAYVRPGRRVAHVY